MAVVNLALPDLPAGEAVSSPLPPIGASRWQEGAVGVTTDDKSHPDCKPGLMYGPDGFHPDLTTTNAGHVDARTRVHHVKASELSSATAQTEGMRRFAAISGASVGSEKIWMGETQVSPETVSDNHHHGDSETAIFVRSGNPEFVFHDGVGEVRVATAPGDYVFVPPYVPHREENPDPNHPAVIVIARSTQEAIVVNLPELYSISGRPAEDAR